MGSADSFKAITQSLDQDGVAIVPAADAYLTPYLSIIVAILYMMSADGDISDRESSQLQSVVGADASSLRRAVAYAENYSIDQFLREAPPLLDAKDRLCLLMNVCDSLMADGAMEETELQLFDRMMSAFGQSKAGFQPYFDVIALKGKTSLFGDFNVVTSTETLTPPMALVVSLIYMMAADGAMADEEVGRLNAAVGCSSDLLKAGVRYVSQVRAPQFFASAARILDERQRLCILLNACDTMMSDRDIAKVERDLFRRMLNAFSVTEKDFEKHLNLIYLKNDVPPDVRKRSAEYAESQILPSFNKEQADGLVFERKIASQEEGEESLRIINTRGGTAGNTGIGQESKSALDASISRTMNKNIDMMSEQISDKEKLVAIEKNLNDEDFNKDELFSDDSSVDTLRRNNAASITNVDNKTPAPSGPTKQRAFRDAEINISSKSVLPAAQGVTKLRALHDAESNISAVQALPVTDRLAKVSSSPESEMHLDADAPALAVDVLIKQRAVRDAYGLIQAEPLANRMQAVRDRTCVIHSHLEVVQSAKSIAAASRVPVLPSVRFDSTRMASGVVRGHNTSQKLTLQIWEANSPMLLPTDQEGTTMSENQGRVSLSNEEAKLMRNLRHTSAILLPALFLTYGITMVGELVSQNTFVTNENMVNDARIVHQMASVQQTVYLIAPNAVSLSIDKLSPNLMLPGSTNDMAGTKSEAMPNASTNGSGNTDSATEVSDRKKAESFLEGRKQELMATLETHQAASIVAAERQQWFVYAKSIALLGIGMAFWGVLFRSMRMLHASTAIGIAGMLLAANGHWLFLPF